MVLTGKIKYPAFEIYMDVNMLSAQQIIHKVVWTVLCNLDIWFWYRLLFDLKFTTIGLCFWVKQNIRNDIFLLVQQFKHYMIK